jgi:uncharacterized membrane protein YhiD involved in acid resistance
VEALGINLGYLIVQILNFAIMFIILRKWVFVPIANLLERRKAAIAEGLENARVAAEARENAEQDAEKIIAEAQAKANQIVREATERAENNKGVKYLLQLKRRLLRSERKSWLKERGIKSVYWVSCVGRSLRWQWQLLKS